MSDYFKGGTCVVATMHGKEEQVVPVLAETLGLVFLPLADFDTDRFGTFTGDVPRMGTQEEAARRKAEAALAASTARFALASEGSFGPHPSLPFVTADRELLLLLERDQPNAWMIWEVSVDTNAFEEPINSLSQGLELARTHGFPEAGMVVKAAGDYSRKGLCSESNLEEALKEALHLGEVTLLADLRAMHNPKRRAVIAKAARQMAEVLEAQCPSCSFPGFRVVEREPGLPCAWCGTPGRMPLRAISRCQRCTFQSTREHPDGITEMPAQYCDQCNP